MIRSFPKLQNCPGSIKIAHSCCASYLLDTPINIATEPFCPTTEIYYIYDETHKKYGDIVQQNTSNLTLYHFESCPFCRRVRDFLATNHIELPLKDTLLDTAARQELLKLGGKTQVPALRMADDTILYESNDIIQWLRDNVLIAEQG